MRAPSWRAPGLESLFVATLVLFGFRLGARPIRDNSMLTHLRTGIDMVGGHGIPRVDPYSYTAAGKPWVVQSWLPEWTYGWAHRLGGFRLVVLEQAVLMALVAWLVVRLARAGSPLRTALAGGVAIGIGAPVWAPRPLLFGLVCTALLVLVVERNRSPWLLVPLAWVWVNSHGSFPLALLWLGARVVGERLDWRSNPTVRHLGTFLVGLLVSVINPLGPRLLAFPLTLGSKQEAFNDIVEWRSPSFQTAAGRTMLVFLALALVILLRTRVPWRDVVPATLFVALALVAARNLPVAAIVLAPALGRALRRPAAAAEPAPPSRSRARLNLAAAGVIGVAFVSFGSSALAQPGLGFGPYPVAAVAYLQREGLLTPRHRLVHQDFVGNYLTLRFGRAVKIFIDDRVDMFPLRTTRDYTTIQHGGPDVQAVLDRYRADTLLWDRRLPVVAVLQAAGQWHQAFRKGEWVVLRRSP